MTDKEHKKIRSQFQKLKRLGLPVDRSFENLFKTISKPTAKKNNILIPEKYLL